MGSRQFGSIRKLPSGQWQASYTGPDRKRHTAKTNGGGPLTFNTKGAASAYLARVSADIQRGTWLPEPVSKGELPLLNEYAATWLASRDLAGSTRNLYSIVLRRQILPAFGGDRIDQITPAAVRSWFASMDTGPRQRAAAYTLLRTMMNTAVADDLLSSNPCRVRGGGSSKRAKPIEPASIAEVESIALNMPPRFRAMTLLAAWCGLRFGELAALTRSDIDVEAAKVHVRRAVSREARGFVVKEPKSEAGLRSVSIPPHIIPVVREHLRRHVAADPGALLFGAEHDRNRPLHPASLRGSWRKATDAAGCPGRTFHSMRHTGAVLAAATGATLAELMARMGHSTPLVAMTYQHAAQDRDAVLAVALSELATNAQVIPLRGRQNTG